MPQLSTSASEGRPHPCGSSRLLRKTGLKETIGVSCHKLVPLHRISFHWLCLSRCPSRNMQMTSNGGRNRYLIPDLSSYSFRAVSESAFVSMLLDSVAFSPECRYCRKGLRQQILEEARHVESIVHLDGLLKTFRVRRYVSPRAVSWRRRRKAAVQAIRYPQHLCTLSFLALHMPL